MCKKEEEKKKEEVEGKYSETETETETYLVRTLLVCSSRLLLLFSIRFHLVKSSISQQIWLPPVPLLLLLRVVRLFPPLPKCDTGSNSINSVHYEINSNHWQSFELLIERLSHC